MKEQLERARALLSRVYSHYDAAEIASAPEGSQLGDWRDGLAQLDAVIASLNPLCNAVRIRHPGVLSEDQTVQKTRCLLPLHHEGDHEDAFQQENRRRKQLEQQNTGGDDAG